MRRSVEHDPSITIAAAQGMEAGVTQGVTVTVV